MSKIRKIKVNGHNFILICSLIALFLITPTWKSDIVTILVNISKNYFGLWLGLQEIEMIQ